MASDVEPGDQPSTAAPPPDGAGAHPPPGYGPPGYPPPGYAPSEHGSASYPPPGYAPSEHGLASYPPSATVGGWGTAGGVPTVGPPGPWTAAQVPHQGTYPMYGTPGGYGPPPGWGAPPWAGYGAPGDAWHWSPPRAARPPVSPKFVVLVAVVVVAALGAGIGIGAAIAPTSPQAARRAAHVRAAAAFTQAMQAARHAGSFRYVEQSGGSAAPETIAGNAGSGGGDQTITTGSDRWRLLLVGTSVYFNGNAAAMVGQLGAPAAVAQRDAGRWIAVPSSTGQLYQGFEVGITTSSNLSQFGNTNQGIDFAASSVSSGSVGGTATTVIHGALGGGSPSSTNQATLTVRASDHLPLSLTARLSNGGQVTTLDWRYSHWGEKVRPTAPAGAIPYASLGATPPSSSGSSGGAGGAGGAGGQPGIGGLPTSG